MSLDSWTSPPIVAVVGMEMTSYTVTEEEGAVVEVCAFVHSPSNSCPIQFPFTITDVSTINGTAGKNISSGAMTRLI